MALKQTFFRSLAALIFGSSSLLLADSVAVVNPPSSGGIWQSWSVSQLSNPTGQPYWNNSSWDGPNDNVGGCLAVATSGCALANQPGAINYLGQSNGQAISNFYFNSTGGGTVSMQVEMSADTANEVFGWYSINNPGQYQILFNGSTAAGTTVNFTPTAQYGLFFYNGTSGADDLFLSDSDLNSQITNLFSNPSYVGAVDTDIQHFAVFQQSAGNYYIGVEDLPSSNSDLDYNDMIIKLDTATATPEPSTVLLLGSGLLAVGAVRFRKMRAKKQK